MQELPAFNQVMSDPPKAKSAIEEFERENPVGSGRKKLIDWVQWKRTHGVVHSYKMREGETLMGIDDFYALRSFPRGKTREASDAEFQQLAKQNYDREGEGASLQLWLPDCKTRMRDVTHYSKSEVEESSKQMKDVGKKEKDELMDACVTSNLDHGSMFLRQVTGQTSKSQVKTVKKEVKEEPEPDDEAETTARGSKGGKRGRVNLADEAPKQYGKLQKEIPVLNRGMQQAMDKVVASLKSKNDSEDACSGPDPELTAYTQTAEVRKCLGELWRALDVPTAQAALKSALQAMGAAARTSPKADAKATAAPGGDGNDHSNMGKGGDGEDEDSKAEKKDKDKDGDKDKETENTDTDKGDQDKNHERKNQNDTASVAAASSSTSSPSKPSSKSVGQQIADMLQKAFKAMGEAAMVVQQPQLLMPIQLVDEEIHSLLEAKTVKELDETIAKISLRSRPSCCQLPSPKARVTSEPTSKTSREGRSVMQPSRDHHHRRAAQAGFQPHRDTVEGVQGSRPQGVLWRAGAQRDVVDADRVHLLRAVG